MWCINCGTKLPENAKFCMDCGTKTIDKSERVENTQSEVIEAEASVSIELLGRKIDIQEGTEDYIRIRKEFERLAADAAYQMGKDYREKYGKLEKVINDADDDVKKMFLAVFDYSVEFLNKLGIYNVNLEVFSEYAVEYMGYWEECYGELSDKYYEVIDYKEAKKEYRKMRKNSRGRMVGGGFGVAGAMKGMAMAGTINATTGILHSFSNAMGNAVTSSEVNSLLNKIFNDPNTVQELSLAVYLDIFNVHYAMIEILNHNSYPIPVLYSDEDYKEANVIFNNIREGHINQANIKNAVTDMLMKFPFDQRFYECAISCFGDDDDSLQNYAAFHGLDIKALKEEYYKQKNNEERLSSIFGSKILELDRRLNHNPFYIAVKLDISSNTFKSILAAYSLISGKTIREKLALISSDSSDKIMSKLNSVINSYAANGGVKQTPILLFDNTAFGSAKDGFLLTADSLYVHNVMEKPWRINLKDIDEMDLSGSKIVVNGQKIDTTLIDSKNRDEFFYFIEFVAFFIKCCGCNDSAERVQEEAAATSENTALNSLTEPKTNNLQSSVDIIRHEIQNLQNKKIKEYLFIAIENQNILERINNAVVTYAKLEEDEKAILLFDNTSFGSGKEGFIITNKYLHAHNLWSKPIKIRLNHIRTISTKGTNLVVNDENIYIHNIDKNSREEFKSIVQRYIQMLTA